MFPYREELLNSLLTCDTITFSKFENISTFMKLINIILGIKFESKRGRLCITNLGRNILVRGENPGIDLRDSREF